MNGSWASSRTFSQNTGLGTSIPGTGSSSPWISVPCLMGQTGWYLRGETTILSKNTSWWVLRYVPPWTSRRRRQEGHFLTSESHKPSPVHPGTQRQLYIAGPSSRSPGSLDSAKRLGCWRAGSSTDSWGASPAPSLVHSSSENTKAGLGWSPLLFIISVNYTHLNF